MSLSRHCRPDSGLAAGSALASARISPPAFWLRDWSKAESVSDWVPRSPYAAPISRRSAASRRLWIIWLTTTKSAERIANRGLKVKLSDVVVETFLPAYTLRQFLDHQLRWGRTVRDSRRWGYLGLVLTFGLPWAVLALMFKSRRSLGVGFAGRGYGPASGRGAGRGMVSVARSPGVAVAVMASAAGLCGLAGLDREPGRAHGSLARRNFQVERWQVGSRSIPESFALSGLGCTGFLLRAYALGCILPPLRGCARRTRCGARD